MRKKKEGKKERDPRTNIQTDKAFKRMQLNVFDPCPAAVSVFVFVFVCECACECVCVCDCVRRVRMCPCVTVCLCYSVIVTDGRLDGVSMNRLNKASKDKRTDNSRKSVRWSAVPVAPM